MTVHYHVLYSGRVQGVGFRYTVQQMARDLDVAGWVKNLPDGSVEMVAEAEEVLVVELLKKIKSFFGGHIKNVQIVKSSASGTDTAFKIVY